MAGYLVIGGGLGGLLATKALLNKGHRVRGLESSESLGGRLSLGHHRLYEKRSTELLSEFYPDIEWRLVALPALQRKKGEWVEVDEEAERPPAEAFYLRNSGYYVPAKGDFSEIIERLIQDVGECYQMRSRVIALSPEAGTATLETEIEEKFEHAVWCAGLQSLLSAWPQAKPLLSGKLDKNSTGGLCLDIDLKEPAMDLENTTLFQFRFKDKKLRALGSVSTREDKPSRQTSHWLLYLEDEIMEDREEVAKVVRALKRELKKEFPLLKENLIKEKIGYFPSLSGESALKGKSLQLHPKLAFLGSEVDISEESSGLLNMDGILSNFHLLDQKIAQVSPSSQSN